jgi:hypothetical protein
MSYSVEWTAEAEIAYTTILLYLEQKWTDREVRNFIYRTEEVLQLIKNNPLVYPRSKHQEIHRALVSSQTSLYYEVNPGKIVLLSFSDNRQDPQKQVY